MLATGRFGGTALEQLLGPPRIALQEQRYEIGIRIEHPNGRGFLGQLKDNDVKLILDGDGLQIRTFCTCRDGEVWHIPYPEGSALSGRSDGPRSGFSNFGLLPRFQASAANRAARSGGISRRISAIRAWHSGNRCRSFGRRAGRCRQ
ncbi:MAG: hypothetical protein MZV49_21815 [Rhodopseudomonas palustris]|nr:hypothetical protein [Rhodopseudomonas palustris]